MRELKPLRPRGRGSRLGLTAAVLLPIVIVAGVLAFLFTSPKQLAITDGILEYRSVAEDAPAVASTGATTPSPRAGGLGEAAGSPLGMQTPTAATPEEAKAAAAALRAALTTGSRSAARSADEAPSVALSPAAPAPSGTMQMAAVPAMPPVSETGPARAIAQPPVAEPRPAPEPAPQSRPAAAPQPAPERAQPRPGPSQAEIATFMERARRLIEIGDITGARLSLQWAASGDDGPALFALAETYNPAVLSRWGVRSIKGDVPKARTLYQKAAERGVANARERLATLH